MLSTLASFFFKSALHRLIGKNSLMFKACPFLKLLQHFKHFAQAEILSRKMYCFISLLVVSDSGVLSSSFWALKECLPRTIAQRISLIPEDNPAQRISEFFIG